MEKRELQNILVGFYVNYKNYQEDITDGGLSNYLVFCLSSKNLISF